MLLNRLLLLTGGLLIFIFLFSGGPKNKQASVSIQPYQSKDALQAYLEKIYDVTDEDPLYFSNQADSLEHTLWRLPKSEAEQSAYLDFVLNIAYHLLQQGQIQASTRWYEKGWNYQQEQQVDYDTEEYIIKPLGNNYVRLGDYDKAVAIQQAAIAHAIAARKDSLLPSLYSNLALSYYWLGRYPAAQEQCNKGLQYTSTLQANIGLLYNVKADAFYAAHQTDSAVFYNKAALQMLRLNTAANADPIWMVSALQLSAKLLADQKQWQAAVLKLQTAEKILTQSYPYSRQRDKARLKTEKAILFFQLQQSDSSIQNFKEGLQYFSIDSSGYFPDHTVTSLYAGLAKAFSDRNPDSAATYFLRSVANDYYCSQLTTSSINSLQNSHSNNSNSEDAIVFFEQQYRQTNNEAFLHHLLWLMELSKGRKLLNEQQRSRQWLGNSAAQPQQQLMAELRNDYLLLAETNDSTSKALIAERIRKQELQLGLQENRFAQLLERPSFLQFEQKLKETTTHSALLSYAVVRDQLYVIAAADNHLHCKVLPSAMLQRQTDSLAQTYFTPSSAAYANNPAVYFTVSNQLLQQLVPFNLGKNALIISAENWLHKLPFEALSTDGTHSFLAEEKAVSYVYSFLQYVQTTAKNSPALPVTAYTFGKGYQNFAALPNSITEAAQLARQYKTLVYEATTTQEQAFVSALQSASIIHIASHAVADTTGQPYLVLQQKFYLGQLQYIVTATPLVVLTACETATGKEQPGEGLTSIGRAFISKGVKAVVASRWLVDDAVAPSFVQSFYTSLQEQHSPVTALHQARKQYLQSTTSLAQKNPLLWSGFCYIGIDQSIQLKPASVYWYWLLLLLLPAGFYFFRGRKKMAP